MEPRIAVDGPCDRYGPLIQELVDGQLAGAAEQELDAHLAACGPCRALLADLREIRRAAADLPLHTPRPEVWSRISRQIGAEQAALPPRAFWTGTRVALAMAATLVVGVSASLWVLRVPPAPAPAGPAVHQSAEALVKAVDEHLRIADENYQKAIAGLELVVKADQAALDPAVAATLQKNLGVIDQAIHESREAIKSQPHSELAQTSLFEALRQKVALLEDTIALINVMRKGDQAGAAKIIGGLSKS